MFRYDLNVLAAFTVYNFIYGWLSSAYDITKVQFMNLRNHQMMKLMEALEYVRVYIDDLLVITRGTL